MHTAGLPTTSQLRNWINKNETNPAKRARLFEPFGGPRSAIVNGLTEKVLEFVVSEWDRINGSSVLDYGCGTLPYLKVFEFAGAQVTGADIGKNSSAKIRISDDGKLPLENSSYSYVVSFQVLEHVPISQDYLHEAYRVLNPGGKIFITTHGLWPYHPTPEDHHRWTVFGLTAELERAGFKVEYSSCVLNEYSALIQNLVITAEYQGKLKWFRGVIHFTTHCLIVFLDKVIHSQPALPAVICIKARK